MLSKQEILQDCSKNKQQAIVAKKVSLPARRYGDEPPRTELTLRPYAERSVRNKMLHDP